MQIAVLGYGVVGSGVVELFEKNKQSIISKSTQDNLDLKYILEIRDCADSPYSPLFTKDFNVILNDARVKIVVETMGGLHPAYEYVKSSLRAGKHVVSSNKELVATFGYELLRLADKNNVNFLFEASVGGGIPIIRPISQCLAANEINEIAGILNGTTNFILTKMFGENMSFEDALSMAQKNGYAERDPSADIDGIDSCRKICILASLCFGNHVFPKDTFTEGISSIKTEDVEYAKSWGGAIKLIGKAKKLENGKIHIFVSPALVQNHSQIAHVDDVFNAILVRGDAIGEVVFYGRGAGKMPTASAVLADIIDCAKHDLKKKLFGWGEPVEDYVENYLDMPVSLYVRSQIGDFLSTLAHVEDIIPGVTILKRKGAPSDELAFVTPPEKEGLLRQKLEKLPLNLLSIIRVTDY